MVTTIQLSEGVKSDLDRLKTSKETYEQIILRLIMIAEKCKRTQEELLIEGYKVMAEESLRICEEFKYADSELDWEWNENGD